MISLLSLMLPPKLQKKNPADLELIRNLNKTIPQQIIILK